MIFKHSLPVVAALNKLITFRRFSNKYNLSETVMGLPTGEIIKSLQAFAPLTLAESWDNVGLLVDTMTTVNVNTVLLTNDLTEAVVKEAINIKAGLIITYHPNIFQGLKSVSSRTWKERVVVQCVKNNISVFSPHTSWDSVEGGVNDWLAKAFAFNAIKAIQEKDESQRVGAGRLLRLESPITVQNAVELVKNHIQIPHLRLALGVNQSKESQISSVALCAGSGHSVLSGVEADLYLTGEMLHHDILDATQKGVNVVLCNHSDSERGFLKAFQDQLKNKILGGAVKVVVSEVDRDPLITV